MKRNYRILLLMFGCICCLLFSASGALSVTADGDWELVMDKNGIKAYSRKVCGSGIFEFRAVMVVDAAPEVVGEMLRDVPSDTEWLPYCDEARVLEKQDQNNFTIYLSFDLPWPVKDRDLVMKSVTEYDFDHARAISNLFSAEVAACPPNDSHIRMTDMTGQYVFEFVTRQRTGIIHTYRADLRGNIPEWMANYATQNNIYNTFMNMKKMFKKEKYIALGKNSPDRELTDSFLADKQRVKNVLEARLREFIGDGDFVDMMMKESRNIDDVLDADNGRISETLLYGWGSEESKKKAIKVVLEIYLAGLTRDEQLTRTILNDDHLVGTILSGPGPGERTSRQIIASYLETGCSTGD
jgi:hypothetical protein